MLENFRKFLESGDWEQLAGLYAEDAILDGNVPAWRYQRRGRAEIAEQYRNAYGRATHGVVEWDEKPAAWGAVVEMAELFMPGTEQELYARTSNTFELKDGMIVRHTFYCTGPWEKDTVARQQATAPMVEG